MSLVSDVRLVERFGILHQSKTLDMKVIDLGSTFESKRDNIQIERYLFSVSRVHVASKHQEKPIAYTNN